MENNAKYNREDYQTFTTIETPKKERNKLDVGDIWENAARCRVCYEYIRSKNRHDYRICMCGKIAVDGGSWYARRSGNPEDIENNIISYKHV